MRQARPRSFFRCNSLESEKGCCYDDAYTKCEDTTNGCVSNPHRLAMTREGSQMLMIQAQALGDCMMLLPPDCQLQQAEKDPHFALFGPGLNTENFMDMVQSSKIQRQDLPGIGPALWPAGSLHADYAAFYHKSGIVLCQGGGQPCK